MSALSRFEQFIEQLLEGSFTRLLRSQLQPVEIAKRLARAMEDSQAISAGGRIIVANRYDVLLSPQDFSLFEPYKASLEHEMAEYVVGAAKERQFSFASRPVVSISANDSAMPKRPLVKASKVDTSAPRRVELASPVGDEASALGGETTRLNLKLRPPLSVRTRAYLRPRRSAQADKIPINRLPFVIGRGLDNDLVLEDVRVSRHHARIEELNKKLLIVDLGSSNGTSVNGESISKCLLKTGDLISLGGAEFLLTIEEGV